MKPIFTFTCFREWNEDHMIPGVSHRTQSNVNRTIKFDFVQSSNEIELTKSKCKSNQIEHLIKSDDVWFSSVAERHLSERLTSSHDMIWMERMFGLPSFDYHRMPKCVRPVLNVVLLPCQTQMNLAWQWHDDSTAMVSKLNLMQSCQIQIISETTKQTASYKIA